MSTKSEILAHARALASVYESALARYRQALEDHTGAVLAFVSLPSTANAGHMANAARVLGDARQALDRALWDRITAAVSLEQLADLASQELADRVAALESRLPGEFDRWPIP